ncbi:hypothetical protein CYY_002180 [Polysphondylium violaceum]|uniref:Uncharacterized protein n=1 Tax=Polysphondylium violaceum TaxID=133409 RepID=A0A8J4V753_9MYCE|nr:hypothetical protein CYY_002180 [Polysphondylium violaceum]
MSTYGSMPSRPGLCATCNTYEKNLYNHNKSKHEDEFSLYFEGTGIVPIKRDSVIKKFKCRYCQSYYESQSSFKMHFKYKGQHCLQQYSKSNPKSKSSKHSNTNTLHDQAQQQQNTQNNQSQQNNNITVNSQGVTNLEEYQPPPQKKEFENQEFDQKGNNNGKQVDVACCTFDDMILIPTQDFTIPVGKKDIVVEKECLKIIIGKQHPPNIQAKKQFNTILSKCFQLETAIDVFTWHALSYHGSLCCQKSIHQEEPTVRYNVHFTVDPKSHEIPKQWKVRLSFLDKDSLLLDAKNCEFTNSSSVRHFHYDSASIDCSKYQYVYLKISKS